MSLRWLVGLAVVGFAPAPLPAAEDARAAEPTLLIQIKPIDAFLDLARYVGELDAQKHQAFLGKPSPGADNPGKEVEATLAQVLGPDWRKALDPTRPAGLVATIVSEVTQSPVFLLVPVGEPKEFLKLLGRFGIQPDQDKEIYSFAPPGFPTLVYFRFAHRYAYLTIREPAPLLSEKALPAPERVFRADEPALVAVRLNIDRVPKELRQLAAGYIDHGLAVIPDQGPTAGARALLQPFADTAKQLLAEGREMSVRFLAEKGGEAAVEVGVTGEPGSKLAGRIRDFRTPSSRIAGGVLAPDAVANLAVDLPHYDISTALKPSDLAASLHDSLAQMGITISKEKLEPLTRALLETSKLERDEQAVSLRGPLSNGRCALIAGRSLKDGKALERAVKGLIPDLPPAARERIRLDARSVGGERVHEIDLSRDLPPSLKKLFGDGPILVAFRDDGLFLSYGEGAASLLEQAMAGRPRPVDALQIDANLGKVAGLFERFDPKSDQTVRQLLGPDLGTVRLLSARVEGGESFKFRLAVNLPLLIKFMPRGAAAPAR
jgi:hypothetical protein